MAKYDVVVIGAGPAGLFCALSIRGKKVLVLEKNGSPGKKLLISGAGQCNYTNYCDLEEFLNRYGTKGRFLKPALYKFTNKDSIEFFKGCGVESIVREDNKVFPESLKSSDILDALLKSLRENGTEIKYSAGVRNVAYDDEKEFFIIKTGDESYACDSLVIATGGKSYPQTGSTGDGYQIAENLGHLIENPGEALTPVYAEDYPFKELSGISFQNISMSIWRENKKINEFRGDLLFTHVNLSGPLIINNSRYIEKGDVLRFNFTRLKNSEEFTRYFEEMISSNGRQLVKTVIRQLEIPRRFADKVIEMASIEDKLICSQLDKDKRKKLIELISNNSMKVSHLGGYNIAMVTKGGVKTDEINPKTMESKLVKGLYFAGEVIDIDGDTGGFNIQAAFSTGRLAAESINSK